MFLLDPPLLFRGSPALFRWYAALEYLAEERAGQGVVAIVPDHISNVGREADANVSHEFTGASGSHQCVAYPDMHAKMER